MTSARETLFRSALQVSPERIAAMGDDDLNELMVDLLKAQAYLCRAPLNDIRVNTEGRAKDDGCDGWSAEPEVEDAWLGDRATCWQFKAGSAGGPTRLLGEVLKPMPRETLAGGGRFVVVASGSKSGPAGERRRLKKIKDEAAEAGLPTDRIAVLGSEPLTVWCNTHPAVAAKWAGRPAGLWTLDDWANSAEHRAPWQSTDALEAQLEAHRGELDFETGSIVHLHIRGKRGVGKSRYGLELCRSASWSRFVVYLPQASDLRLRELVDSVADDPGARLVVVADEVVQSDLRPLNDAVGRAAGRIRLISIGDCASPDPIRIPAHTISTVDDRTMGAIVKGWYPAMPAERVDYVVRFADGYVQLAKLAADAIERSATIDAHQLFGQDAIRGFLDGMIGAGDRLSLYVVAVLSSVGWSRDQQGEGEAIAAHLEMKWGQVKADVEGFHRRFGIVPRGGRYRYISPLPLGNQLAIEAWSTFPEQLRTLPAALPNDRARNAYFERLRSISSFPEVRDFLRGELASFGDLGDFLVGESARTWSALSAADPEMAAGGILRALDAAAPEARDDLRGDARREVVGALAKMSWRPGAFYDATRSLALLAEAENESWANNATGEFLDRYQVVLGGTAVPYPERLALLDELSDGGNPKLMRLVIDALARVGERWVSRSGIEPASDEVPEKEWRPASVEEHCDCIEAAISRLVTLAGRQIEDLEASIVSATVGMVALLREDALRPMIVGLYDAVREAYPTAREPLRRSVDDILRRDRRREAKLPANVVEALGDLHDRLVDPSLGARLRQFVGPVYWNEDEQPDLASIAEELLGAPDVLREEWPWLTSGDAGSGYRLGAALAGVDDSQALGGVLTRLENAGRDQRLLCGYVAACRERYGDDWYNDWVANQLREGGLTVDVLFDIAWRCGATLFITREIAAAIRDGDVDPASVGLLAYGNWGAEMPQAEIEVVLTTMADRGHASTAISILSNRMRAAADELPAWLPLALRLATDPELIRSDHSTNYSWRVVALEVAQQHPREIAAAIVGQQARRDGEAWFAEYSQASEVLKACIAADELSVWSALEPLLTSPATALRFGMGFPRDVIDATPAGVVIEWINESPEDRAAMIARLTSSVFGNDRTLAARVLGEFGHFDVVGREFFSELISGGWSGSTSSHWESLADGLERVASSTDLPKVKRWASRSAQELRDMSKREREREEEDDFRR